MNTENEKMDNVLVYSTGIISEKGDDIESLGPSEIFLLDENSHQPIKIAERDSYISPSIISLASYNDKLYDITKSMNCSSWEYEYDIYETLTGNKVAERALRCNDANGWSLVSHKGTLYDAGYYGGGIYETLTGNKVAEREYDMFMDFATHNGDLYDATFSGEVYKTLTGERVADRFEAGYLDRIISHEDKLYCSATFDLYETLTGEKVARRNSEIKGLASNDSVLYDFIHDLNDNRNFKVFETLTGEKVAEREHHIYRLISHNRKLYDAGVEGIHETLTGGKILNLEKKLVKGGKVRKQYISEIVSIPRKIFENIGLLT